MTTSSIHARLAQRLGQWGLALFVAGVVAVHLLEPALNPARHQLSEYVHTRSGAVMVAALLVWAVSLAATALRAWQVERGLLLGSLLMVASVGIVMTAFFPTQTIAGVLPAGETFNAIGRLHDVGSGMASGALLGAALVSLPRRSSGFQRWTVALVAAAVIVSVVLVGAGREVGGVRQRLVVGMACAWQALLLRWCGKQRVDRRSFRGEDCAP